MEAIWERLDRIEQQIRDDYKDAMQGLATVGQALTRLEARQEMLVREFRTMFQEHLKLHHGIGA